MHRTAEIMTAIVLVASPMAYAQELYRELDGDPGQALGRAAAPAGDVDQDGFPDVILGGWDVAKVVSGRTGQILYSFADVYGYFGNSVAGAGDVDADGYADLIIGAPFVGSFPVYSGSAFVHAGFDGHLLFRVDGTYDDQLGTGVSGANDVNGDGYDDVLIGAPRPSASTGTAYALLISGQSHATLHKFTGSHIDHYGATVGAAGDLDSDGIPDLLVGQPFDSGTVYAYSGRSYGQLHVWSSTQGLDGFGTSLGVGYDLNGDGVPEVVVGAPGLTSESIGYVQVFSGATGNTLGTLFAREVLERFGQSVALVNDANGDGVPDLIVGAPWYTSSHRIPKAWLFSGATGNALYAFDGDPKTEFGDSVADAGDLDGDGRSEVLVGAPYVGPPASGYGQVTWYLGNDLYHHIEPRQIAAGDTVTHTTREGDPGQPTVVFVTEVNGVPRFQLFGPVGFFDLSGTRVLSFTMPPGYSGLIVKHRAFALDASGKLVQSSDETVTFE